MDSKLDKLLEKYWNAETDLQEEQDLRKMLKDSKDPAFEKEAALMDFYGDQKEKELGDEFDEEMLALIEKPETKVISIRTYFNRYVSIAAAVLVMAVSTALFLQNQNEYSSEETFETPEQAYAEFKRQMLIVSNYMNKGNQTVSELSTLGSATDELSAIGKLSAAEVGLEMLEEMNVNN